MTARAAAIDLLRESIEELQPPGREYADTVNPPWLRGALASPENARAIAEQLTLLTNEARRLAADLVRRAERGVAVRPEPTVAQLGLF